MSVKRCIIGRQRRARCRHRAAAPPRRRTHRLVYGNGNETNARTHRPHTHSHKLIWGYNYSNKNNLAAVIEFGFTRARTSLAVTVYG